MCAYVYINVYTVSVCIHSICVCKYVCAYEHANVVCWYGYIQNMFTHVVSVYISNTCMWCVFMHEFVHIHICMYICVL
jgi:hypothetical protein